MFISYGHTCTDIAVVIAKVNMVFKRTYSPHVTHNILERKYIGWVLAYLKNVLMCQANIVAVFEKDFDMLGNIVRKSSPLLCLYPSVLSFLILTASSPNTESFSSAKTAREVMVGP